MALTFQDLDHDSINEIGTELAKARERAQKTSQDFILDLRTTRHHINAIESGDLRIFYGAPFYIDLMRRYAKLLSFSDDEILNLENRVTGITNESNQDEWNNKLEKKDTFITNKDKAKRSSSSLPQKVFSQSVITRKKLTLDPDEIKLIKEKNEKVLFVLISLVIISAVIVFGFSDNEKKLSKVNPNKYPQSNISLNSKVKDVNDFSNEIESLQVDKSLDNIKKKYITNSKTIASNSGDVDKTTSIVPSDIMISDNAQSSDLSQSKTPDLELYAVEKTWFWIRYADDTIKEFMVDSNTRIKIVDFPIYLVIGNPERVEMLIKGLTIPIKRNDPDRNLARYTRTELRLLAK